MKIVDHGLELLVFRQRSMASFEWDGDCASPCPLGFRGCSGYYGNDETT